MLRYTTDRARPGLVAWYDIWPGNGVGQFLQPRSPHGAAVRRLMKYNQKETISDDDERRTCMVELSSVCRVQWTTAGKI